MVTTTVHTLDTAPEASKPLLENSIKAFGRLPSLHGVMATSPGLLEGYQHLHRLAIHGTAFTPEERTVVWMTVNVVNRCHYCVPAHTGIAKMEKIDESIVNALRDETPLPEKLEACARSLWPFATPMAAPERMQLLPLRRLVTASGRSSTRF